MLSEHGYEVVGASNVAEACTILEVSLLPFHLILTDYHLPDATGLDLLLKITSDPARRNIPVIFLTKESSSLKMQEAMDAGLSAWILKPYRAEEFFTKVRDVIKYSSIVEN